MKRVLIILITLCLFAACKNKGKDVRTTEKTDNRTNNNSQDNNKDNPADDSKKADYSSHGWTSDQVRDFVDNCVSEAEKGALSHDQAQNYCSCMQQKLERKYPDPNDAVGVTENSEEMKQMATDCLTKD